MDSYTHLLEKTRVPQPSLQKFAVISIFAKLRSAPDFLDPDSEPGREAISQCLHSSSPAVVEQTVRELCRLVLDSKLDISRGFLEFQSALEGADTKLVGLFVKGLGFLTRIGFERNHGLWQFVSHDNHPFVKILSSRTEVQSALLQQVLLFMVQSRRLGMVKVCEFLRPFVNFSILRIPFSDSASSLFSRQLISCMASFCCSFIHEAIPVFRLLMGCLKCLPHKNSDELRELYNFLECIVDAYIVVLRHLVRTGLLMSEGQQFGIELSETILSLLTCFHQDSCCTEPIVEQVKRVFVIQKDLALHHLPELSSIMLPLFLILTQSELEHEQLSVLKFIIFLVKWKCENEYASDTSKYGLTEELLFTYPVINLLSSTSRSVKGAATDLLIVLEKLLVQLVRSPKIDLVKEERSEYISSLGSIVYRLLHRLWFQDQFSQSTSFFVHFAYSNKFNARGMQDLVISWASQVREHCLSITDKRKSSLPISQSLQTFLTEIPPLLGAITTILVMNQSLANIAVDLLAAVGVADPKQGVPLLLTVLFYCNIFTKNDINYHDMLPKLLVMLPSLASHSVMIPLIIQSILPMLQKNGQPFINSSSIRILYATGARLLCKTWEMNDRAFGSLQTVLLPKGFIEFESERIVSLGLATSIRDVCRKHPDRGVDLILSVSACIESQDPIIRAVGFQSLGHLCEADAIDFYTAWDVIAKNVLEYSSDPVLAHSICLLLRWGAMDAEAYPEASSKVLQILWLVASMHDSNATQWAKARASAFEALSHYEVSHIEKGLPDFRRENMELLLHEPDVDVLKAMEGFQVKIMTYEHINRRRLVKEKKVIGSKIEKLLDVFPQVLFSTDGQMNAVKLPGAALLSLSFTPRDVNPGMSRVAHVHAAYENAMVEIASSLDLSRNIFVALLSLQSWKAFMRRWMRANILSFDVKASADVLDKTSKAANIILKSTIQIAEESIPRSAENILLAVGALSVVLPPSVHSIKSTASKFLLNYLFEYQHEHLQWSAAISLGLLSSCLHATDHKQKFQNISGLIEVLCGSKSTLVKGACGVGLGFSCQDLLTRVDPASSSNMDGENHKIQETVLLGKAVRTLLLMTGQLSQASYDILEDLSIHLLPGIDDTETNMTSELLMENCNDLEEDIWGVAGIVLGLGCSVGAIYRAGAHDVVIKIKDLIISWIPHVDSVVTNSSSSNKGVDRILSVGSCLALPVVVDFCQRMELMNDDELDHLVNGYIELISELVSVKKSGTFHQSLLMAACIGAGSLLACILSEAVHPIKVECVEGLLELFRTCYSKTFPALVRLGGMLGVVNAMGASAGALFPGHQYLSSIKGGCEQESSCILGPLLSSRICEPRLSALIQEIFLVAQNSDDLQMKQIAAWALSFLRNLLWSKELQNVDNNVQIDVADTKIVSRGVSEEALVMKLSLWLMLLNFSADGATPHIGTVAAVLRCLIGAPRLPTMNWGSIIKRCMKYEARVSELVLPASALKKGSLREECVNFSIAHANQFDSLLIFLDELSELSRFRNLEFSLQSCLLVHLANLAKIFSISRVEKLFDDITEFFSLDCLPQIYDSDQKTSLRMSCWKGICQCLDEASLSSLEYISNVEKCMEVLFSLLPAPESTATMAACMVNPVKEWYEVVQCFAKARGNWLSDFLQVPLENLVEADKQFNEVLKKIVATSKLVTVGAIPLAQLGILKAYILNSNLHGVWDVLVEVVAALQCAEGSVKRQWLVDAIEICCMSSYPSTALHFVALLSGSCCKYMPILTLERLTVLSDLPVTLPALLTEPNWNIVATSIISLLWTATERLYNWVNHTAVEHIDIDESENGTVAFLLLVTHQVCLSSIQYLPLEKQLRVANMLVN